MRDEYDFSKGKRGAVLPPRLYPERMSGHAMNYKDLPLSERIQLVEDIWDSIAEETSASPELAAEQRAELDRRVAAHRADPSTSIPWEQVRAELFKGKT